MNSRVPSTIMHALLSATSSPGKTLHGFPCRVLAYRESVPTGLSGSFVKLAGAARSFEVGVLSDPLGWQTLNEALRTRDFAAGGAISDSAFELSTAAACALKREFAGSEELTLGAARFVDGVAVDRELEVQAADIVLGGTRALLVIVQSRAPKA